VDEKEDPSGSWKDNPRLGISNILIEEESPPRAAIAVDEKEESLRETAPPLERQIRLEAESRWSNPDLYF